MTSHSTPAQIRVIEAGLACCGVEAAAVDLVQEAQVLANADVASHILVIAGTVTHALADTVRQAYQQLTEPRVVVAFGACAITGGPYWDSYSVIPGADHVIPVDFHVPGCPPTPEDLALALQRAAQQVTGVQVHTSESPVVTPTGQFGFSSGEVIT